MQQQEENKFERLRDPHLNDAEVTNTVTQNFLAFFLNHFMTPQTCFMISSSDGFILGKLKKIEAVIRVKETIGGVMMKNHLTMIEVVGEVKMTKILEGNLAIKRNPTMNYKEGIRVTWKWMTGKMN